MTATPPASFAKTLLELLAIVVGGGLFDLAADLSHAALDVGVLAFAFDEGGVFPCR